MKSVPNILQIVPFFLQNLYFEACQHWQSFLAVTSAISQQNGTAHFKKWKQLFDN
jgi:hypothetical protein